MILRSLEKDLETVLARIRPAQLERYWTLCDDLWRTNVAPDREYQRTFNAFFRMQRRSEDWYQYYFGLLESKKRDVSVTFQGVIEQIYADTCRVEPSFSSKLVATIRPDKPVYDKYVMVNLCLKIPGAHKRPEDRLVGLVAMYASLEEKVDALVKDEIFKTMLKPAFDRRFGAFTGFTDVKKLDFLLWQYRRVAGKA